MQADVALSVLTCLGFLRLWPSARRRTRGDGAAADEEAAGQA
jgi:hypothetical protein